MRLRDACEDDLPAIVAIYNHAVLTSTATADVEPQALDERRRWWHSRVADGLPVLVAVDDDARVLGWGALGRYHSRWGYRFTVENSIYVHADARGRGIGRTLLDALVERAAALGFHVIVAGVDGTNTASLRLHERAGFRQMGRLREVVHKFDRWLDVVYLQRTL
jgi:phosphinothricin acetyltransferase